MYIWLWNRFSLETNYPNSQTNSSQWTNQRQFNAEINRPGPCVLIPPLLRNLTSHWGSPTIMIIEHVARRIEQENLAPNKIQSSRFHVGIRSLRYQGTK
jgi:hypothetical protein